MLLVVVEHDRGSLAPATAEAMTFGRTIAGALGVPLHAVTIGVAADGLATELGAQGATVVHQAHDEVLTDYGPEAWGETVARLVTALSTRRAATRGPARRPPWAPRHARGLPAQLSSWRLPCRPRAACTCTTTPCRRRRCIRRASVFSFLIECSARVGSHTTPGTRS